MTYPRKPGVGWGGEDPDDVLPPRRNTPFQCPHCGGHTPCCGRVVGYEAFIDKHLSGTGHATLAEMRREFDALKAEVAARRIASDFVPCKFCGPTHAEVTDCGWCDGHGRCPSDQMQDNPIACYEAVEKCIAATDAARPKEPT